MSKPIVYLAGPMAGCSWDEASDWRVWAAENMPEVDCRSPLRGKDWLESIKKIPDGSSAKQSADLAPHRFDAAISTQHAIVVRDHFDVMSADVLLVNLLPSKDVGYASIGTCFELAWAWMMKKPAIVTMQSKGNPNDHPFPREAAYVVVPNLRQAVAATRLALNLDPRPPTGFEEKE